MDKNDVFGGNGIKLFEDLFHGAGDKIAILWSFTHQAYFSLNQKCLLKLNLWCKMRVEPDTEIFSVTSFDRIMGQGYSHSLTLLSSKAQGHNFFSIQKLSCWHSLDSSCWVLRWVPMCHGFSHFSGLLHHLILAKIATSSIRVKSKVSLCV